MRIAARVVRSAALAVFLAAGACGTAWPQPDSAALVAEQDARATAIARQLWDWAELDYREERSSALLRSELEGAGLPTAFIASAGRGKPVIAILAEFDALPGSSPTAAPRREVRDGSDAAHACGHNLFAGGSIAAAIATARWLERSGTPGTIDPTAALAANR